VVVAIVIFFILAMTWMFEKVERDAASARVVRYNHHCGVGSSPRRSLWSWKVGKAEDVGSNRKAIKDRQRRC
jgi:hypothetical protein